MATTANTTNSFNLSGFVAVNAEINTFDKNAVARFPLSVSRTETNGAETIRKSALINCECWRKSKNSAAFNLLKKGTLVQISGYLRPEEWEAKDGTKRSRIIFVATSVSEPATDMASKTKTTKKKEAA